MARIAPLPSTGVNRVTGKLLIGWPHVMQSLDVIFTTPIGVRTMREWFGSMVPKLLGQNMTPSTILKFWTAIYVAVELWEPRYKITAFVPIDAADNGKFRFAVNGLYLPRALEGDFTPEGARTVTF